METDGTQVLPADILHLICEHLSANTDFATLYSCVASSRALASSGAITALYRISHDSPVKGGGSEGLSLAEQGLNVQKWSILWRTIILSALGKTMYPYCRHLRMLDLRDLSDLLEDDKFRNQISKHFFAGDLAQYHILLTGSSRVKRLDAKRIVRAIGDEIIPQAPLLESLSEPAMSDILSTALIGWAPSLVHLQWLDLWDASALQNETLRNLLHVHCPNLESLKIYLAGGEDSDHAIASFISGMPENKLKYFENHRDCGISTETCLALNRHGQSMKTLKLALSEQGILALALLQECTNLNELSIVSDRPTVDLKATQNDVYLEIVKWLRNCASLKDVSFENITSAPDLITPVLLNESVTLEKLDINATKEETLYVVKDHHDFHRALASQKSLQLLHLSADPDPVSREDVEILMSTFCSLNDLRDLKLTRISDYFTDEHINSLASKLPELEDLYIGGYGISDAIWHGIGTLKSLKTVSFGGITTFTSSGIAEYIDQLGPGNTGITLSVDNADPDRALSQEEQDVLRELMFVKVDGRFEYQLLRDPNMPTFDSDDSD